jgi:hypothetical protein
MPRRALIAALMLIGLGVFLGTTIFREDIAYAAQLVSADIVGPLDAQGNVKVHEQETANVNVTNRALAVSGTVNVDVTTSKLLATPPGGLQVPHGFGGFIVIGTVDTASSSQVRIAADNRQDNYCNEVFLRVDLEDAAGPSRRLLDIDLCQQQTGVLTRVVDIPGTELRFSVENTGDFDVTVDVTVWGR